MADSFFNESAIKKRIVSEIVAFVGRNYLLECGDRALDHIVGRFKHRNVLKPNTGSGDYLCDDIIVSARKLDKLVSKSHNKGSKQYFKCGSQNDVERSLKDLRIFGYKEKYGIYEERNEDSDDEH